MSCGLPTRSRGGTSRADASLSEPWSVRRCAIEHGPRTGLARCGAKLVPDESNVFDGPMHGTARMLDT